MAQTNGTAPDFNSQEVVQPGPLAVTWLVGIASIPNPVKGTTLKLVTIDAYGQYGMHRYFLEPAAALAVAERITAAAKQVKAGGVIVVDGGAAQAIAREARKEKPGA